METIRPLELDELKEIYRTSLKKDFPPAERRPFYGIKKAWEEGNYSAMASFSGQSLQAYACFYQCLSGKAGLLDYLAVTEDLRGQGIGSRFLADLLPLFPDFDGIYIEAESEDSAKDSKEREKRQRRLHFYRKNGAEPTGMNCLLFHVDYQILYLPTRGPSFSKDALADQVVTLYKELYGPVYGRLCKPYAA